MLAKAFELINEQYDREGLTLAQAAGAVHLSVSHFCRLFKQATGMTFHRYLNHYRIVQARQMLELGAWAVVVGGAITRPLEIAQRFMDAVRDL